MRRKNLVTVLTAGLCAGAMSVAAAGVATATPEEYLYDLQNNGNITGPKDGLLKQGNQVCDDRGNNVPPADTIDRIYRDTKLNSRGDAQFLYESAVLYLC